MLYTICLRITGQPADAADAAQEAMIKIVSGLGRFDGRSRFSTWAYRIAANAALDELRRRRRRPEATEFTEEQLQAATVPQSASSVAEKVDVERALARLPVDYRAAVVLRDLCGLDYAEIADVLSIPAGTVRSRIARGRAALIPHLGGNHPSSPSRPNSEP